MINLLRLLLIMLLTWLSKDLIKELENFGLVTFQTGFQRRSFTLTSSYMEKLTELKLFLIRT